MSILSNEGVLDYSYSQDGETRTFSVYKAAPLFTPFAKFEKWEHKFNVAPSALPITVRRDAISKWDTEWNALSLAAQSDLRINMEKARSTKV